jgi:hypothetical protein
MSDYYIRITDEEPIEMEKGIRFKYDGTGSEAEFTIVDDESYSNLVEQFNIFSTDFQRAVNYNISNILENRVMPKSEKASKIVSDINDDNSEEITFQQIKNVITNYVSSSTLSTLSDTVSSLSTSIESILDSISQLTSQLSNKSDKTHSHTTWTRVETVGNWTSENCILEVNTSLRIAHYHISSPFTTIKENTGYTFNSNDIGNIPPAYRPPGARFGSCRGSNGGSGTLYVTKDGKIGVTLSEGWTSKSYSVYGDVWWRY